MNDQAAMKVDAPEGRLDRIVLPPLEGDIAWILGQPCFAVAGIARRLHELGLYEVARKAEAEQAAALHWMLGLHAEHGENWREHGDRILRAERQNKE